MLLDAREIQHMPQHLIFQDSKRLYFMASFLVDFLDSLKKAGRRKVVFKMAKKRPNFVNNRGHNLWE